MAERASACNRKDLKAKGGQRTVKCPVEATMAEGVEEWGEISAGFKSLQWLRGIIRWTLIEETDSRKADLCTN
jgi:hypothetical protein